MSPARLRSPAWASSSPAWAAGPQRSTSRAAGTSKEDFERAKRTAKKMWKGRKTTAYLKCPNCGQMLSVPKGKGKIRVTCPSACQDGNALVAPARGTN